VWGCGGPAHSLRSTFHRLHLLRLWTPTILNPYSWKPMTFGKFYSFLGIREGPETIIVAVEIARQKFPTERSEFKILHKKVHPWWSEFKFQTNVGKLTRGALFIERMQQCAALMIERTPFESVGGSGLSWSVASYVRIFHRLHLLRLWTPTILFYSSSHSREKSIKDCHQYIS
jgi:hypothetical protein